jgi:hypothetical protein
MLCFFFSRTIRGRSAINILNESLILVSFFSKPFEPVLSGVFVGGRSEEEKSEREMKNVRSRSAVWGSGSTLSFNHGDTHFEIESSPALGLVGRI